MPVRMSWYRLSGTEEVYAAVTEFEADFGIEITASHNPINYNGMKIVVMFKAFSDMEFKIISELIGNQYKLQNNQGFVLDKSLDAREAYLNKIINLVDVESLEPPKIVINSGNGAAGPVIDSLNENLKKGIKTNFHYVCHKPDSSFPNGIPNL